MGQAGIQAKTRRTIPRCRDVRGRISVILTRMLLHPWSSTEEPGFTDTQPAEVRQLHATLQNGLTLPSSENATSSNVPTKADPCRTVRWQWWRSNGDHAVTPSSTLCKNCSDRLYPPESQPASVHRSQTANSSRVYPVHSMSHQHTPKWVRGLSLLPSEVAPAHGSITLQHAFGFCVTGIRTHIPILFSCQRLSTFLDEPCTKTLLLANWAPAILTSRSCWSEVSRRRRSDVDWLPQIKFLGKIVVPITETFCITNTLYLEH